MANKTKYEVRNPLAGILCLTVIAGLGSVCGKKEKMICIEGKDHSAENKSSVFLKKDNVL